MSTIIVPTDFSATATAALRFAALLADKLAYKIEVVHVHDGHSDDETTPRKRGDLQARESAKRATDQFVRFALAPLAYPEDSLPEAEEVTVCTEEIVGDPINIITRKSKREDVRLVVMGGVGSGRISAVSPLFGSIARSVALKAGCPVFLIPSGSEVPVIKTASIAFDTVAHLRQVDAAFTPIRNALEPTMRLAHVRSHKQEAEDAHERKLLDTVVLTDWPGYPLVYDALPPGKVAEQLLRYTEEEAVDLLVVGQRKLGFFQRLFVGTEATPILDAGNITVLVVPIAS